MTEPDFAMGTSLVAGTARGLAPLPAFLLGAEAVPLLWVGDGKVSSPSLEGGQVAVLRLHAASTGHVTKPAYSCVRGMYVRCGTKVVRVPRKLQSLTNTSTSATTVALLECPSDQVEQVPYCGPGLIKCLFEVLGVDTEGRTRFPHKFNHNV